MMYFRILSRVSPEVPTTESMGWHAPDCYFSFATHSYLEQLGNATSPSSHLTCVCFVIDCGREVLTVKGCSPAVYYCAWHRPLFVTSSRPCTPSSLQRLASTGTIQNVGIALVPYWQGMGSAGKTMFREQSDAPPCLAWHG